MALFGNLVIKLFDDDPSVQEEAIRGLVKLAIAHPNRWELPEFPDALAGLVRELFKDERPRSQELAAWALGNLSCGHAPYNKLQMANYPQMLPGLVRLLLSKDGKRSSAQEEAVRTLRNLACAQENNHTISLFPGAFPALLKLLFDNSNPGVQIQATMAVLNLLGNAMAKREGIVRQIPSINETSNSDELPDALECLVMLWFSDTSSRMQGQATSAIVTLVERTLVNPDVAAEGGSRGNVHTIAVFPDSLLGLLRSLLAQSGQAPRKQRRTSHTKAKIMKLCNES